MERTAYKEPKFYLDRKKDSTTGAIFLKYSFAPGQRISYFTGHRIELNKWSLEKQRVKRNVTGASDINEFLYKLQSAAKEAVSQSRLKNKPLTKEALKQKLDSIAGKTTTDKQFFDIFNEFISSESLLKAWTTGTLTKLNTIRTQLEAFEEDKRKRNKSYRLDFSGVNERLLEELIEFWQTEYDLRNSTIQVYVKLLRWFFKWSVNKGYSTEDLKAFKIKLKQASQKVIFLDMDEIGQIFKVEIESGKEYLERTRDIFIFQCLTGLRFSDLRNLKASDINGDSIHVNTIKTGETIEIELNDTTRKILAKYATHQTNTGNALPVPVNQNYNRFLKELAQLAGLYDKITLVHYKGSQRKEETFEKWQLITTHTARRSFITNGLTLGIASEVIRSWTGHQSERSFKGYYEIVKNRKRSDIDKMNL